MGSMPPGLICDLFILRRRYDDEQHGIKREKPDIDISDDDLKAFEEV